MILSSAFFCSVMAQLLPPVCTDALKFQNPLTSLCPRSRCAAAGKNNVGWSSYGGKRKGVGRIRVASQESASSEDVADDYYAVLGLVMIKILSCLNFILFVSLGVLGFPSLCVLCLLLCCFGSGNNKNFLFKLVLLKFVLSLNMSQIHLFG